MVGHVSHAFSLQFSSASCLCCCLAVFRTVAPLSEVEKPEGPQMAAVVCTPLYLVCSPCTSSSSAATLLQRLGPSLLLLRESCCNRNFRTTAIRTFINDQGLNGPASIENRDFGPRHRTLRPTFRLDRQTTRPHCGVLHRGNAMSSLDQSMDVSSSERPRSSFHSYSFHCHLLSSQWLLSAP